MLGGIGAIFFYKNGLEKCNISTVATVVDFEKEVSRGMDKKLSTIYYPVVEYQVGDKVIQRKASTGQNPPDYYKGEEIEIRYNEENPKEFIIVGDNTAMILAGIFIAVSVVIMVVSFIVFIILKKEASYG